MTKTSIENNHAKIFLDTNVILDAFTMRDNSYQPSKELLRYVVGGKIHGYICSKQITDIFYVYRKYCSNKKVAKEKIKDIASLFEILPLLKGDILACLHKDNIDFEDAILCEVAKVNRIKILVTNNPKHFKEWPLMILTPKECLDLLELNQ